MDVSSLLRKPRYRYKPDTVRIEEPRPPDVLDIARAEMAQAPLDRLVESERRALLAEIGELDILEAALLQSLPEVVVPVPQELTAELGMEVVTGRYYAANLASEEYGPVIARGLFEAHQASPYYGEPAYLYLPLLSGFRDELKYNLESLSGGLFSESCLDDMARYAARDAEARDFTSGAGAVSIPGPNAAVGAIGPEARQLLSMMAGDRALSEEFRADVLRGAAALQKALRTNWLASLGYDEGDRYRLYQDIDDLVEFLRKLRAALRLGYTFAATDVRSILEFTRSYIMRSLVTSAMDAAFQAYSEARAKLFSPLMGYFTRLSKVLSYAPWETRYLFDGIGHAVLRASEGSHDTLTDIYIKKRKLSNLRLSGSGNIKQLVFMRGVIKRLDVLIEVLPRVASDTLSPKWTTGPDPQGDWGDLAGLPDRIPKSSIPTSFDPDDLGEAIKEDSRAAIAALLGESTGRPAILAPAD